MRAQRLPTRHPRPSDRTGTHPGQPRPLTDAPHSIVSSRPSTPGPPISATQTGSLRPTPPHRVHFREGCAAYAVRRLSCFPRPLNQPQAPCHPVATKRAAEGGATTARGGAHGLGGARGGLSLRQIIPTSKHFFGPGAIAVHWWRMLERGGVT